MLHIDLPTRAEIAGLSGERDPASVSIYLETTPVTQATKVDRIELKNLAREAISQLEAIGTDKRRLWPIEGAIEEIVADDEFWAFQARSLAILATPERIRTFRLANRLTNRVEVSDRFHIKPLLRAIAFPQDAFVLALAEGGVRLVEVSADLPPVTRHVPGLPKNAADALGSRGLIEKQRVGRSGEETSQSQLLARYARVVDRALRPVLTGQERPLILAAAEPLASAYPAVNSYPHLATQVIHGNAEKMTDGDLAAAARGVLGGIYAGEIAALTELFGAREAQGRVSTDIAQAARAATFGAIDTLLVDMDVTVPGFVSDEDGAVTFAAENDARSYGIVDEIAARALRSGARVIAARRSDIPGGGDLAAILRYAI